MKDCTDCKYDVLDVLNVNEGGRRMYCKQGHYRQLNEVIKDCHGWIKKPSCFCKDVKSLTNWWNSLSLEQKSQVRYCPFCGKEIEGKLR